MLGSLEGRRVRVGWGQSFHRLCDPLGSSSTGILALLWRCTQGNSLLTLMRASASPLLREAGCQPTCALLCSDSPTGSGLLLPPPPPSPPSPPPTSSSSSSYFSSHLTYPSVLAAFSVPFAVKRIHLARKAGESTCCCPVFGMVVRCQG